MKPSRRVRDESHVQRRHDRDSDDTLVVEGNHYFPPDSVRWEHLAASRSRSVCPWKDVSSYYDVNTPQGDARAAAWSYRRPFPWIRKIRNHVAFWGAVEVGP